MKRNAHQAVGLLIGLFILLGFGYDSLTPIFENSDEPLHYPVIQHIAAGNGLPIAQPGQAWNQEGTQPPLYYTIVAASTFWIDTANVADFLQYNPHWLFTDLRLLPNDNQNRMLPSPTGRFPYQRAALAIHIGRWWSLLFGALTVLCSFLLGRQLFPHNLSLVLTATALVALTPQFLRVSATVSNDSLSAFLTTLTLYLTLRLTQKTPDTWQIKNQPTHHAPRTTHRTKFILQGKNFYRFFLLGLLCGLAILTKLSSLAVVILVGLIILWRGVDRSKGIGLRQSMSGLAVVGSVSLLVTGWWFYRNYWLYGEWFATEIHLNLAGRGHLSLPEIWALRAEILRAYWATFGWGQIRLPEWLYQGLGWFVGLGLIGLLIAALKSLMRGTEVEGTSLPQPSSTSSGCVTAVFLAIWTASSLALYVRWVMEVGSVSHTRLMFPAIAAIALLLIVGWQQLLPRSAHVWFGGLLVVAFIAINLYSLMLLQRAFTPNALSQTDAPVFNYRMGPLRLTHGQLFSDTNGSPDPSQGNMAGRVQVYTEWEVVSQPARNYSVAVVLHAPDGQVLARRESFPGLGLRPTLSLKTGDRFSDIYPLELTNRLTEPIVAHSTLNLFDLDSPNRAGLPTFNQEGLAVTPIIGQIKLVPHPWPNYHPSTPVFANFADQIALIGYDWAMEPATLTLYWQALSDGQHDYTTFIHLLDEGQTVIAQADGPPTAHRYPTRWWAAGERIADPHNLPMTAAVRGVRLGLYEPQSGARLQVVTTDLPMQDNGVWLELVAKD